MRRNHAAVVIALSALIGLGCDESSGTDAGPLTMEDAGGGTDAGPCSAPGSSGDGEPCRCDEDCTSGAVCLVEEADGDPGGRCQRLCDPTVECSPGAECVPDYGDVCYSTCGSTADCVGPGRVCDSNGYCASRCAADGDCLGGRCEPYTGLCSDTPATGLGLWADCTSSDECRSAFCGTAGCVTLCVMSRDFCPDGSICIGTGDSDSGFCANPCTSMADCEAGESCAGVPVPSDQTVCLPDELLD